VGRIRRMPAATPAVDRRAGRLRRIAAVVFAGDARTWKIAAVTALPLVAMTAFHALRPRFYYTGTDSVDEASYIQTPAGTPLCTPSDLELPAGTAFVRLRVRSPTRERPPLRLVLHVGARTISSTLSPVHVQPDRISNADFPIPETPAGPAVQIASLCAQGSPGAFEWAGASMPSIATQSAIVDGAPQASQVAVWFLPPASSRRSYVQRAGAIFQRAALFRPGFVGAWTYPVLLFLVLPALALLAVRCLALALARSGWSARRAGAWLFAIAAVNFACWALITPAFQAPDEVDHYAYVQSLVERGEGPSASPATPFERWSNAESLALEVTDFITDHEVAGTSMPWSQHALDRYAQLKAIQHPPANNGGGYSTSAAHGPLYYLALAPGYLLARNDTVFAQLTLMRLLSALLGALAALFAFLLARELAPTRPWLAVLAGLLVVYEPMYGFISGAVNNDVGVNAAAAALAFLLIRLLRRGLTVPWGLATGVTLVAVPLVKETGLSLYPVAALVLAAGLWRYHRRTDLAGWAALALGAILMDEVSVHVLSSLQPPAAANGLSAIGSSSSAASYALHHIPEYLSYLWQLFLPRLPGMAPHFSMAFPGYTIFVQRGWGAFGWYDVFFSHWIYVAILVGMLAAIPLGLVAAGREWTWIRGHWVETLTVVLIPLAVIAGFEAAYYSPGVQTAIPTFGRYVFPAIAPLAVLVVGVLHAFGRRAMLYCGVVLLVGMIALSYSAQVLVLTSFYA
jgi:hypothetical protein